MTRPAVIDGSLVLEGQHDTYYYHQDNYFIGITKPLRARGASGQEYVLKRRSPFPYGFEQEKKIYELLANAGGHVSLMPPLELVPTVDDEFLVFSYLPGEDLVDVVLREKRLSPHELSTVFKPLCPAVDFLHHLGIVHRDLTMENIRLPSSSFPIQRDYFTVPTLDLRLYDFNCSVTNAFDSVSVADDAAGSPHYLAPESFAYKRADWRVDLYALAVMAFRVLTGEFPFESAQDDAVMLMIEIGNKSLHQPIPHTTIINSALPAASDDFFYKGLAKNPEERFQTAVEFYEAFCTLL